MDKTEQDIIAALLKIVRESGLIPEATYRAALNKLLSTRVTKERIAHGHSESAG